MKKYFLLVLILFLTLQLYGQRSQKKNFFDKPKRLSDNFLMKQWWLGFKAGPNVSKVIVETPYYVISPTNYNVEEIAKEYENFRSVGSQVAFELTFYFKGITISFQPSYRINRFLYSNGYQWGDVETPEKRLTLKYEQSQRLAYLDWPVIARYEFSLGKVIPYIQLGVYSSILLDATKAVTVSGVDYASGGVHHFENQPVIIGAADLFAKYHWGIVGGGGLYYALGNVRINVDLTYKKGMSNISSTQHRYGSDRLAGVGDSLDDMKLDNITISAGCLFPLRFLGSGFKSMVDK